MELIYSANKPGKWRRDSSANGHLVCSLSSRNLIAFSCSSDLRPKHEAEDEDGNVLASSQSLPENCYHLYVCDIDKPWQVTHLCSNPDPFVSLVWHVSGTLLLVATKTGECSVWQMKDFLINEWTCAQKADLGGEEVVAAAWLHQGTRVTFNTDKKDSSLYHDKVSKTHLKPSLSSFGGKPLDGWIAITATALVCVGLYREGGKEANIVRESLMSSRGRVSVADLAFVSSGDILAVTSDSHISSAIQCFKINLTTKGNNSCSIKCQVMAGFFAKCHLDSSLRESPTAKITHVKYMHEEDGDTIIVGAGDTTNSHMELWHQTTELVGIHRLYQGSANPDSSYSTRRWVHQTSITHVSLPISIAVPRFPVISSPNTEPSSVLFQYVAVAYLDGSVKLVDKHNFQPMTTTNLDMGITDLSAPPEKRRRSIQYMTHMQQSLTGCVLVGLDQYGCLYAMKAVNTRDPVTQVAPVFLVGMLEYAIVTMRDWWDIMTAIRPGVIETVLERLSVNFSKQPSITQDLLYQHMMAVRSSLFRCSSTSGGQQRAADCHCRLMLHSISQLFKSLLRPKPVSSQELSAVEKLNNSGKSMESNIDKVMVTLNPEKKEFVVESGTLQTLQQLIQWVGDLTLYLLSSLPMSQGYNSYPAHSLLRDALFLSMLRQVLVVIRMWGLINPSCLPHFASTSANFDCLPHFFKLLTRIWMACKDGPSTGDFEEGLIDDCCLLQSQVLVNPVDEGLFGDMNYGASIFSQPHPVQFIFGEAPSYTRTGINHVSVLLPEGQSLSQQRKDIVRLIYLGRYPQSNCRQCSRCGCLSLAKSTAKSPALRAWELRFNKTCSCGGHWMMLKNKEN